MIPGSLHIDMMATGNNSMVSSAYFNRISITLVPIITMTQVWAYHAFHGGKDYINICSSESVEKRKHVTMGMIYTALHGKGKWVTINRSGISTA